MLAVAARDDVEERRLQRFVIGPRVPAPIWRRSISRTGVTSAAVPVMKTSSAM